MVFWPPFFCEESAIHCFKLSNISVPESLRLGFASNINAIAPVTYTVAALVPDESPQLFRHNHRYFVSRCNDFWFLIRAISGIIGGHSLPLLSPTEEPSKCFRLESTPPHISLCQRFQEMRHLHHHSHRRRYLLLQQLQFLHCRHFLPHLQLGRRELLKSRCIPT